MSIVYGETNLQQLFDMISGATPQLISCKPVPVYTKPPQIEDVIFHSPATIVKWKDGTKTVVKCQKGDTYNKEFGLALCYMKKMLGNNSSYNEILKKWTHEPDVKPV